MLIFGWIFIIRSSIVFGLSVVRGRGLSNSVFFNRISTKGIVSIKLSFKFEYGFCPTKANQDGQQNGCLLSVSAVVVSQIWMSMNFKQNQPQTVELTAIEHLNPHRHTMKDLSRPL